MKSLARYLTVGCLVAIVLMKTPVCGQDARSGVELAKLRPAKNAGFENAGWAYDRYKNLKTLDANKKLLIGDMQGPGIIKMLHFTRHGYFDRETTDFFARGIVLEIWFDDAKEPAVRSPLADFFGDGCNGNGMNFTSNLIESAPGTYNCYFPMPFRKRARVYLCNETDRDTSNYSFIEWERLDEWDDELAYFHATYRRDNIQLTQNTDLMFLDLKGKGHVIGRQFSVITNEPLFGELNYVMEGNNEIDIDGEERKIDYLGTEDSFTFSWGFNNTFAGLHAGMTIADVKDKKEGELKRLSIYRFHDHMPIAFEKSLKWHINYQFENGFVGNPKMDEAIKRNGCWVDIAAVHYWYQQNPGGFKHAKLRSVEERRKPILQSSWPSESDENSTSEK